jgi:hypothetical protein
MLEATALLFFLGVLATLIVAFRRVFTESPTDKDAQKPRPDLRRPFRFLNWSFLISLLFWGLLILSVTVEHDPPPAPPPPIVPLLIAIMFVALFFFIALGQLARRLDKSSILWVGLSVLTWPLGSLIAFFLMRDKVKAAIRETAEPG